MDKPIAVYLRGAGQELQMELCLEYAKLYLGATGEELRVFRDEGSLAEGDPAGLTDLMTQADGGEFGAVLCEDIGVICRNTAELLELVRRLEQAGATLHLARLGIGFEDAVGRTFLYAAQTLLELERSSSAANIRDNMRALARGGRWLGGVTPTGYTSVRAPGQRRGEKNYRLELLPDQAETVRLIYALFLEKDSLVKVTRELADRGIKTKNGRAFSRFTVRQILENPVYMQADADAYAYFTRLGAEVCSPREAFDGKRGMMVYNKTVQAKGEANQQRAVSEWIVAVGEHKPILDATSWIAAQQQLARNKSAAVRRPKSEYGLIAELLYCGDCGAHMRPKLIRRPDLDEEPRFSYICERKEQSRSGECDMPNLTGQVADGAISAMLAALDPDEPDLLPVKPDRPDTSEALAAHQAKVAEKKEEIAANQEGISKLVFTLINAIDKSAYEEIIRQINALHEQNAQLSAQVEALEALAGPNPLEDLYQDALRDILEQWEARYREMGISRRRAALRTLIESITWDREELVVRFAGGAQYAVNPF